MLLTQTGLSRLVARLVDKGLVARSPDPTDGRSTLLSLTEEGRAAQKRIGHIHAREITAQMLDPLSEEDLNTLAELAARLLPKAEAKCAAKQAQEGQAGVR